MSGAPGAVAGWGTGGRRASRLESVHVVVPEAAVEAYEAALLSACGTVGLFLEDEARRTWRLEGVKEAGEGEAVLATSLALAGAATGCEALLQREDVAAEGWLARTYQGFPEQLVGRFALRGTHLPAEHRPGRITLVLDAGLAFGSGEHGSTRGCLLALEAVARRRPRRILDLGTGSGILAMAAARLLRRPVLATDIEPWSVRVAGENARANGVGRLVRPLLANGWRHRRVAAEGPYDLVFGNILARPLCLMAGSLARALAPGGTAILAGLLTDQARMVLTAHRRHGLRLERRLHEGAWTTLVLRRAA